jgi:predicted RNA-binding protein YlxR (DUF448 family)
MEAAHPSAPLETALPLRASERRCIVTGDVCAKDGLIRFAISPDKIVVPDLAQNLPGRGLWVTASHDAIQTAARKNLFSKAAKQTVKADPNLADHVAQLMRKRCLEFIGLARRSGIAVLGQPQVEAALKSKHLALLLLASDASQTPEQLRSLIPAFCLLTRDELGAALGHEQIVYAGLKAHGLTDKLKTALAQLTKLSPPDLTKVNG